MHLPILREAAGLPHFAGVAVSIGSVLTLNKRGVHLPAALRSLQGFGKRLRCSGSNATWSQQSPCQRSSAPQLACFFPTKDHFSSICTSRVRGGKSDQFFMQRLGLIAREFRQPAHRTAVDLYQSTGLANPAPLGDVIQNRHRLVPRQAAVE